jgi:hypothetical protein
LLGGLFLQFADSLQRGAMSVNASSAARGSTKVALTQILQRRLQDEGVSAKEGGKPRREGSKHERPFGKTR